MKRKYREQQIDKYVFPYSTVEVMKNSIDKTEKTNKEHAFSLCLDKKTNEIYPGEEHVQKGDFAKVSFEAGCERKNQKHIGTFHTHINSDSTKASARDIHNNCQQNNKIDCIGSSKDRKIVCMNKTNPMKSCEYKVRHLVEDEELLITKNEGSEGKLYSELDKMIRENFKLSELKY